MSSIEPPVDTREALLRRHLQAASSWDLLTDQEELDAADAVAEGRIAENELASLGSSGVADLDHIAELRALVREGEEARDSLIGSSRRLVVALARRHHATVERTVALLAAGDEALSRAVDRYDPTGGLPFSAFARWWIERAMREVERHPAATGGRSGHPSGGGAGAADLPQLVDLADPTLLTALGHLHRDDCRVVELRLGLGGGPALSPRDTADLLGVEEDEEAHREELALAKLRHPSTPGVLTHLRRL